MHGLIAAKKVKTQGQRRGMTYHPAGGGTAKAAPKAAPKAAKKAKRGKRKAG